MNYNFDEKIDRRGSDCLKWDFMKSIFGSDNLKPFWIADMDFKAPDVIVEAMTTRMQQGVFGYAGRSDSFYASIINWFDRRHGWKIKKEWIVVTPGVVPALSLALQTFTQKGDGIIIQPPVYFPFDHSIQLNGREAVLNPLKYSDGQYQIDWDDLEEKAVHAQMLIFCSPHNPVGRVWSKDELTRLGHLCERHDLLIFSDEIHSDIIFPPHQHHPLAMQDPAIAARTITAYATSKTFNLAGLQLSINIIPDQALREKYTHSVAAMHLELSNVFGLVGTQSAYDHGEEWLEQLLVYLWQNYQKVDEYLQTKLPIISVLKPESTFLLWLDCRALNLTDQELSDLFLHKAGLALSPGEMFGPGGHGFMRLNMATPSANLIEALEQLKQAIGTIQ